MSRSHLIEFVWSSRRLEKTCADDLGGRRAWGADNWQLLKRRLASLAAARTLEDMDGLPGRCHQLHGDRPGTFAMTLWGGYRLVFEPDHDPVPRVTDGGIDRSKVTRILIKEVVNYHGD
jgi:proteic killer suppression protein